MNIEDDKSPQRGKSKRWIIWTLLALLFFIGIARASEVEPYIPPIEEQIVLDPLNTGAYRIIVPIEAEVEEVKKEVEIIKEPIKPLKEVLATISAYTSSVDETDSTPFITASGTTTHLGTMANNCLPFGTLVEWRGKIYTIEDRMNSRYGCNYFDVWVETKQEARQIGRVKDIIIIK